MIEKMLNEIWSETDYFHCNVVLVDWTIFIQNFLSYQIKANYQGSYTDSLAADRAELTQVGAWNTWKCRSTVSKNKPDFIDMVFDLRRPS